LLHGEGHVPNIRRRPFGVRPLYRIIPHPIAPYPYSAFPSRLLYLSIMTAGRTPRQILRFVSRPPFFFSRLSHLLARARPSSRKSSSVLTRRPPISSTGGATSTTSTSSAFVSSSLVSSTARPKKRLSGLSPTRPMLWAFHAVTKPPTTRCGHLSS
jgi:hypothetical protein